MNAKLVFISKYDNSFEKVLDFIEKEKIKKVCYVALNKTCGSLIDALKDAGDFNEVEFFFIDGITSTFMKPQNNKKCVFVNSPKELDKISININMAVKQGYKLIVIDSLSTIFAYGVSLNEIYSFMKDIIIIIKKENGNIIALCDRKDKSWMTEDSEIYSLFNVYSESFVPFGILEEGF